MWVALCHAGPAAGRHHGTLSSPAPHPAARTRSSAVPRPPALQRGSLLDCSAWALAWPGRWVGSASEARRGGRGHFRLSSLRGAELQGHGGASSRCAGHLLCCVYNWGSGGDLWGICGAARGLRSLMNRSRPPPPTILASTFLAFPALDSLLACVRRSRFIVWSLF